MFLIRRFLAGKLSARHLSIGAAKISVAALLLAMGLAGVSGCAYSYRTPGPEPMNSKVSGVSLSPHGPYDRMTIEQMPIVEDDAMAARQWNPSVAYYQNDTVMTHPNYAPLEPTVLPDEANAITETPLFLANIIYLPVGLFIDPPWIYQANKSLSMPPTYTAMPPLTTSFTALPPRPGEGIDGIPELPMVPQVQGAQTPPATLPAATQD